MTLNESRLFSSFASVHRYSGRDVADLTFLYLISLHVLRAEYHTAPFAKSYAQKTLAHGDWDDPYLSSTDLYQLLNISLAHSSKFRDHLKDPTKSNTLFHDLLLDTHDVKRYLQNIQRSHYDDSVSARLLFRFERDLRISVTNYKSVRRICSDWNSSHIDHDAKSLAVTRLLQAMRNRANWGDLVGPLQSLAKFEKLEIQNACDPETGKNCDVEQPSAQHMQQPPQTKLSLLKQLVVGAGLGVGAYYLGKALAGGFKESVDTLKETTVSGNVATLAQPFSAISRRPSLFGYIPEEEAAQPAQWKAVFKRSGQKEILAGDAFVLDAASEAEARKLANQELKSRWDLKGARVVSILKLS